MYRQAVSEWVSAVNDSLSFSSTEVTFYTSAVSAIRRRIVLFVCGVHALVPALRGCDSTIGVATSLTDPEPWQI